MDPVQTYDPRSGGWRATGLREATPGDVAGLGADAGEAAATFGDLDVWPLARRAGALRALAGHIEAHADELAALADEETALGPGRLQGEIVRTVRQLELFAAAVDDGTFLEVVVDPADPAYQPAPRPDLRRMLQPIGPVAVFAASNFPFAFSVAGGDSAAALAAGCPVIVKAHEGHPRTSERTADLVATALGDAGAPAGTFALVHGRGAGRALVTDPHVKAVGFTGSLGAGRALFDLAAGRPDPIPFYGELGSINPTVVTPAAVAARGPEVAAGFVASFTLGNGQFCTKPGLLFLPAAHGLDEDLRTAVADAPAQPLLTPKIVDGFHDRVGDLGVHDDVRLLAGDESGVHPRLYTTTAAAVATHPELADECFGPAALVVEWKDEDDLAAALDVVTGSLTATVHAEPSDRDLSRRLLAHLRHLAGRIIWNGWPTGVSVTAAMHHGGPWPATTNPLHTSVGLTAIRRFLVPVVYQDVPQDLLPAVLQDP